MIFDGLPYTQYAGDVLTDLRLRAIKPFIHFIEKKLGVTTMYNLRDIPFGQLDLSEPLKIALLLRDRGILRSFDRLDPLPDEPPFRLWNGTCGDKKSNTVGGASVESDAAALFATVAEGIERYIWYTQRDYFLKPLRKTPFEMSGYASCILPERFAGFSEDQRKQSPELQLKEDSSYLWIQGTSLISNKKLYIPAQTVSVSVSPLTGSPQEPLIRTQTTIGLATWPTQVGARLAGALEVIEREAYVIMWLNQLTVPKVPLTPLRAESKSLDIILERCERYRLKVHALRMATDAPTHAICAIVEDQSGHAPRFAFGLRAHRSLSYTVEKAVLEALRARSAYRRSSVALNAWDPNTPIDKIGHRERMYYWGLEKNAVQLEFLTHGKEVAQDSAEWEKDTEEEHMKRIIKWCRDNDYECASVAFGISAANPTPWYIEMVIMPDLQPIHLTESRRHLGGARLKSIPTRFGYTPREHPFIEAPHPHF